MNEFSWKLYFLSRPTTIEFGLKRWRQRWWFRFDGSINHWISDWIMNSTFIASWTLNACSIPISIHIHIHVDIHILSNIIVLLTEALLTFAAIGIKAIPKIDIVQGMLVEIVGGVFDFDLLFGCVWRCDRCRIICIGWFQFGFYFGRWFIESTFIDAHNARRMWRCGILNHIKRLNANTAFEWMNK